MGMRALAAVVAGGDPRRGSCACGGQPCDRSLASSPDRAAHVAAGSRRGRVPDRVDLHRALDILSHDSASHRAALLRGLAGGRRCRGVGLLGRRGEDARFARAGGAPRRARPRRRGDATLDLEHLEALDDDTMPEPDLGEVRGRVGRLRARSALDRGRGGRGRAGRCGRRGGGVAQRRSRGPGRRSERHDVGSPAPQDHPTSQRHAAERAADRAHAADADRRARR